MIMTSNYSARRDFPCTSYPAGRNKTLFPHHTVKEFPVTTGTSKEPKTGKVHLKQIRNN